MFVCVCLFVCWRHQVQFFLGLSLALRSHDQFQASHWPSLPPSLGNLETQKLGNLETRKLGNPESRKLGNSETWKLGNLETQKLGNSENWKLGNLETQKLGNLETPKFVRMKNGLVFTFPFLHASNAEKTSPCFFHHNKSFINYVFCRNWAIRNPSGT